MSLIEHTFSDLNRPLSLSEASGGVCPTYFGSQRRHQVPHDWPSPILRFLAPSTPSPKPSARRPVPHSGTPPLSVA